MLLSITASVPLARLHKDCPKGAGLDLRLGNRFIVFRRTSTAYFDPLEEGSDPKAVQVFFHLNWNEDLVLHPNELVLGATLEYLRLPEDLSGQVITRSSYGRLGLLSATAVQIHPHFRGCLTLELVNLSTIPIRLSPGERVAQLVLNPTKGAGPPDPAHDKYKDPIGPQFSKVRTDDEARVIRGIRST
jgi:deoxycytidine triphosphate deaminase